MSADLTLESLKIAISALGVGVTIAGGFVAYLNWKNAVRWKRAELGASYLQPFFDDEEVTFALRCIDWGVGKIPIPKKYENMMTTKVIVHSPCLLVEAMKPDLTYTAESNEQCMLYRLAMDTLFGRIEWIANRVESNLITREDVGDLEYWLKLIASWPYAPRETKNFVSGHEVFLPFLKKADYLNILRLMRRFGIDVRD